MIVGEEIEKEEDAHHVFLLMGKEYRISRSIRAQWFFQQFNSTLPCPKSNDELITSNEELEVLSVLPKDPSEPGPYRLVPSTHITFIGRRYRFVFCLDISPSLATVDIQSGTVITDEVFERFKNCLCGLVTPFSVPGSGIILSPELYITVLAYTSILNPEAPQVLIQGCLVTEHNVKTVLEMVLDQLMGLEDFLAKTTSTLHGETSMAESDQGGVPKESVTLMSPEAGPISILRNALLALQLLPDNASAGAVMITDGVFALPDASAVNFLLAQLRASTVCCSFIKVGSGFHAHCSLGYVPHCDMMQFIAMATSGAYLAKAPPVQKEGRGKEEDGNAMNLYHKALLCWNFQRDFDLSKIDSWMGDCLEINDSSWPLKGKRSLSYALSEWEQNAMQPSMRKRHLETKLHTSITSVLSVRLREGYSIQDVSITKGGKQLQVKLTIPWKHNVQIEYLAHAAWPLCHTNCTTHVEVTIEAPYEFLHDVTYPTKKPFTSGYRTLVVKRFRQTMKSLQGTDELLVHLQSFSSNAIYYTIPESAKDGVPLFYLPPNSSNPVLSLQHGRKSSKSQESQFAVFWKPVLSLDTTVWQKWMHCHRIGLVLEHDVPLPKNLHLPAENDRSSAIQCRVALSSLNSLFRGWSSFVLLENHSYIKFIKRKSPDDAPISFCIARIIARGPCIVIKVAFLGGTEGFIRHEIVSDIRTKLSQITAPLGQIQKPAKQPVKGKSLQRVAQLSSQRLATEKPCAILYDKPLERVLVRYERIPGDLVSPYPEVPHYSVYDSLTGVYAHRTNENHMKVLCQYLHHHRWIWTMQDDGSPAVSADHVARILSTLTKLRLQEGFHFVNNSVGIITMAKELKMKDHTRKSDQCYSCVIQYVLFPPYHRPSEAERSDEAVVDWAYEVKPPSAQSGRTFNMVTEVWAEPQFGRLTDLSPELRYLESLMYNQVPNGIYQVDVKHVSALLTFDHLWRMCDDQSVTTPQKPLKTPAPDSFSIEPNWVVEQLPFPFDVLGLLPKTRQVEMVFSSLIETIAEGPMDQSESPNEHLFKLLLENMERLNDREVTLTEEDWNRFLQHLSSRPRHGIPLPFPAELCPAEQQDGGSKKSKAGKPLVKWRCFVRAVTALGCGRLILTFLPASLKYVKLMGRRGRRRSSSATNNRLCTPEQEEKNAKEVDRSTLSIGLLSRGSSEERSATPTPTIEKEERTFERSDSVPFSYMTNQRNQEETPEQHEVCHDDDEKRSVTFKEETAPARKSPPFRDLWINEEGDYYSFDIPVYCYDCPMSALITVTETNDPNTTPEEAKKREDIFQDFTQSAAQIFMDPFSFDEVPRALEGQTRGRFGSSKDLLLHCSAVHDLFFRSFVSSTFLSLQRGQLVSKRDVHSAVDACEENFLEVDITEFMRTLCGHYINYNKEKESLDKDMSLFTESRIPEEPQSVPIYPGSTYTGESFRKLKQCLASGCESVAGLHKSITAKFMSILGRCFKAVPSSGEYFFYCPQQLAEGPRKSIPDSFADSLENEMRQVAEDNAQDKASDAGSDVFDDAEVHAGVLIDGSVSHYELDLFDFESQESESDYEETGDENDDEQWKSPFFLQLTCSLRDRRSHGQAMTPVSINTLPICLGEIIRRIEDDEECLDPFRPSVRITLDLICLTLSQEPDYSVLKSSARNAISRSNSFSSTSSPLSLSPQDKRCVFDFRRQDSKATSHDIDGIDSLDLLHGLAFSQRQAVNMTCDAIRWLLQDEIVSELRHIGPVNTAMLEKVENHVKQSEDHVSCISRGIPLQFVFGAEQSMEVFVKEFEKFSLPEFLLKKVNEYYYLSGFPDDVPVRLTLKNETVSGLLQPPIECDVKAASDKNDVGNEVEEREILSWAETQKGAHVVMNEETREEENTPFHLEECSSPPNPDCGLESRQVDVPDAQAGTQSPRLAQEQSEAFHAADIPQPLPTVAVSLDEGTKKEGDSSKRQHLSQIGRQHRTEVDFAAPEAVTPAKDITFTSSAESTPVGSLLNHGADSINGTTEEEASPRTLQQADACLADDVTETLQFWLVMRVFDNHVDIFFHQRESDGASAFCATRANGLVETVTNAIHEKCRIVNQRMLLHELYETKVCNSMLFPESDEDIWKHEDLRMSVSPLGVYMSKGDSSGRVTSKFVQVQYLFQPGHFGCESVFHTHLPVHQRLRDSSGRPGISRGLKAIKSVLDRFGVSNRKDMFVYKESSGAVFYFRLFESLCEFESTHQCPLELRPQDAEDEDRSGVSSVASLAGSRTPSQWSLLRGDTVELSEDIFDSKLKKSQSPSDRDGASTHSVQPVIEESIALHVYGVDEPGPEITVELVEVLQNRINEAMLEVLSVLLSRNPNCKLTYADVRFIQPQGQPPKVTLTFTVPPMDVNFLCPLSFYLRQNLLQFLHSPRYADFISSHHFKAVNSSKEAATGSNSGESSRLEPEVYLYNRPHSSGGKGLACISASVLNSSGGYIYIPCGKTACVNVEVGDLDYFEQFTDVFPRSEEHHSDEDIIVQFAIWERGDIGLSQLNGQLKLALRHALCDLLIEYYLLTAPLSIVPTKYRRTPAYCPRSILEPVTPTGNTPKAPKVRCSPESAEKAPKRQLDFGAQTAFRSRTASLAGHRRSPSGGSHQSTQSSDSCGAPARSQQNPFIFPHPSASPTFPTSRQSTLEDEVFKTDTLASHAISSVEEATKLSNDETKAGTKREEIDQPTVVLNEEVIDQISTDGLVQSNAKSSLSAEVKPPGKPELSLDVEPTFETFTEAEIQESQEHTSLPGTPISETTAFALRKAETPSQRDKVASVSPLGVQTIWPSGEYVSSAGAQSPVVPPTLQEVELRRRSEKEKRRRRIQFENGERGELHPSLQGLAQDMFAFFRQLGVPSVYGIEGKLINNFATDVFLNELLNLISLLCSDVKPKVYREAPYNSIDVREDEDRPELNCLHYYPARQPLKVQEADESSADRSGKLFAPTPDSSKFFVVLGRNVDQWRASLGFDDATSSDEPFGRPRIRTSLQRFKPLDPNAPVPCGRPLDSNSITSLSTGGVPRQKFILATVRDKDVTVFTYNLALDLNNALDKQLNRLLHWNNARCHLTSCLLSQKLGLFHHTLFADINKGKEGNEVNSFCLSTNDNEMALLISRPGPPALDRERAVPRQMPPSPNILVFDEVLRDVIPPRKLHSTQYFFNRDLVKRHGYQFQEIRSVQIKAAILQQTLDELYFMWQQRPPHVQIIEDKVETLKRSSRLIHYCAAPLLFHPQWREKRAAAVPETTATMETPPGRTEKGDKAKERKSSRDQRFEVKKDRSANPAQQSLLKEDAWHLELRSAYVQQYVQYMQSLQFIVVQTRPPSPKQSRRHLVRSGVNMKAKRESSPLESNKQSDSNESHSITPHCYLQRTSLGGVMLMELKWQGCFFIVRLYALDCSQIASGKTASAQMRRLFVEDCTRYREYIHLLSFNYDFHLFKAQMYLNGSQRIFSKGYGVTHMLTGLLQEYPECPMFSRNRLCIGELAVPCDSEISSRVVFNYLVKNSMHYDFTTLPLEGNNPKKFDHVLLGSERVLKEIRTSDTPTYDILRDSNEYDISFVVSPKDSPEQGVVSLEYLVLMTSRRELFPKLTADLSFSKKSPSSSSLASINGTRKGPLAETEAAEQGKGVRIKFTIPSSASSSQLSTDILPSSTGFHRSASSPHSLYAMGSDSGGVFAHPSSSLFNDNIKEHRRESLPAPSSFTSSTDGSSNVKLSQREVRLLTEAYLRARDHLVHVVCRAQTHCNRDLLWHRLFAGGPGEEEKDGPRKGRRRSDVKKAGLDLTANGNWKKSFDGTDLEDVQSSPARLSFEEFRHLLSVVVCKSLKEEDTQLIPVLSMRATWYLNLFRVMISKFPDTHRLYAAEGLHYLAILNADNPDMFILLHVDESTDKTDILSVFRNDQLTDSVSSHESPGLQDKSAGNHVYNVVNAVCFHLWTSLLPT